MRNFKRYLPWALFVVAVLGLYLQYQSYAKENEDCNCKDKVYGELT